MKKIVRFLLTLVVMVGAVGMTGCSSSEEEDSPLEGTWSWTGTLQGRTGAMALTFDRSGDLTAMTFDGSAIFNPVSGGLSVDSSNNISGELTFHDTTSGGFDQTSVATVTGTLLPDVSMTADWVVEWTHTGGGSGTYTVSYVTFLKTL